MYGSLSLPANLMNGTSSAICHPLSRMGPFWPFCIHSLELGLPYYLLFSLKNGMFPIIHHPGTTMASPLLSTIWSQRPAICHLLSINNWAFFYCPPSILNNWTFPAIRHPVLIMGPFQPSAKQAPQWNLYCHLVSIIVSSLLPAIHP